MGGTRQTALVTGGAGLIGSHIVDAALAAGWDVRILDNLQRQTHRNGKPAWLPADAEFVQGDVRHRRTWERALDGIDVVFHEAAYGGYMPEIAKFIDSNGVGTALLLETIRDRNLPVRKVVVASSQAVYNEGAYRCAEHGPFYGTTRPIAQLARGDWAMHCPVCGQPATPAPTDEAAPTGGENVYAISKMIQERLVLSWGSATGIPAALLLVADRLFGKGDLELCRVMGAWAAGENLPKLFRLFYRLGSPTFIFERASKLWGAHYDSGAMALTEPTATGARLVLTDFKVPHRAHCLSVLGWSVGAIELAGSKVTSAEEERCRTWGHERCELAVKWQ